MAETNLAFTKSDLAFAKIVASPTTSSWSQAYNAGKLFAVVSLEKTENETEINESLATLGKNILEKLEQNFFTLETKDLSSIKSALEESLKIIPEDVLYSFSVGSFSENALYLFAGKGGKALIKRGESLGEVLAAKDSDILIASSGFVEKDDVIVLETKAYGEIITNDMLQSSLDNLPPSEIAEALAPKLHEREDGRAASIVIKYEEKETPQAPYEEPESLQEPIPSPPDTSQPTAPKFFSFYNLTHSKKHFLTILVFIAIILVASIFFAVKKQNDAKTQALFNSVYTQAKNKFDEGQSLSDLNKNLSRDSFNQAQQLLNDAKSKFSKNSNEENQILALLQKVNKSLEENSPEKIAANLNRTKISISVANGSGLEGVAGKAADFLKSKGYNISSTVNADNYKYTGATIKTKNSTKAYLNLLQKDLAEKYTVSST
ncbi:MAG: LytR C-terminal domain-containing protein, partial [Candidatus Levybacteria bacterium]|nr:LytR C-terminal domain-containing protein [Candidatus Levybacteria bacterium]